MLQVHIFLYNILYMLNMVLKQYVIILWVKDTSKDFSHKKMIRCHLFLYLTMMIFFNYFLIKNISGKKKILKVALMKFCVIINYWWEESSVFFFIIIIK